MATAIGLDNVGMLPPFLPAGRNEDGFFGNLLLRCFPEACTAHLPFGVVHQPPERRIYRRLGHEAQTIRLSELMILLLSACPICPGAGAGEAFRILGEYLQELARSPAQFILYSREIVRMSRRGLRDRAEAWNGPGGGSPAVREAIGQFRARLLELIDSPDCWRPAELHTASDEFARAETRRLVQRTGDMLSAWSDMVAAARYLRTKGIRISRAAGDTIPPG
jgi:hypothetical protein